MISTLCPFGEGTAWWRNTQPIARVQELVDYLKNCFPAAKVRFVDTVCQPTKQRQSAAVELAKRSDVVLVVGGANSNNTHELAKTCREYCGEVHHVQGRAMFGRVAGGVGHTWSHGRHVHAGFTITRLNPWCMN